MQHTVDIINYLNANGINFIMRTKGKLKDGDLICKTNSKRKKKNEQATVRIVAVKNELLVLAANTDLKPKAIRRMFRKRWAIETSYR